MPTDRLHYRLSSWLFGRALGVVCVLAFASLGFQAQGLFGSRGVMPIALFVASAKRAGHGFWNHPSMLWWWNGDTAIATVWLVGLVASVALCVGLLPRAALAVAWFAYLSFVSLGWPFMSFQWDTLLLETCFTAVFFVSWGPRDRLRTHGEPNKVARWALWFLLSRLMFRSAWVKLASQDPTWADLSALTYHYWTQPLPTVLAWYANQLPRWLHELSCLLMFIIEFGAPLLLWVPRAWARRAGAILIIALMTLIALTGNYGFFNLLTVLLCLTALDDQLLERFVPKRLLERFVPTEEQTWRKKASVGPALVIALSAIIFYTGTFGERRLPGWLRPIYPFSTFNNYGLFSVMTTSRPEILIEGSRDGENWSPYLFRYKPGPLDEAPQWVAPHQPRLDWQMWFAALGDFRRNPWLASFMRGLLENEPSMVELIEGNPFEDSPPTQIRAVIYEYEFTSYDERRESRHWWKRGEPMLYAPVLAAQPISTAP